MRVDVLTTGGGEALLILQNKEDREVEATIRVPNLDLEAQEMHEQFTGEKLRVISDGEAAVVTVSLRPQEVKVYRDGS